MKGPLIYYPMQEMYGSNLSDTKTANQLHKDILEEIDLGFNIEIDLDGVNTISNSWIKNTFGRINKDRGNDFLKKHILIINANKNIIKLIHKYIDTVSI